MTKIKREIPSEVRETFHNRLSSLYEGTFEDHCDKYYDSVIDGLGKVIEGVGVIGKKRGWEWYEEDFTLLMKESGWTFKTPEKKEEKS